MPEDCPILHVDMDAFFASVEQLDNPQWRGKPLVVGHDGPRGVVAAASYEARQFGLHSAQAMAQAKRLCPHVIIAPNRMERYHEISALFFDILAELSPLVESISVDEAFVDLNGLDRLHGPSMDIACRLKDRIKQELRLTASVGVAPNKFLAKLASDLEKPDGLTRIGPEDIDRVLPPMAVTKIWGIGRVTGRRLGALGIRTIADLRAMSSQQLAEHFGPEADRFYRLSRGIDTRRVEPERDAKSIGHERTFGQNLTDPLEVIGVLMGQAELVGQRLRRHKLAAGGVSIKIRFGDFQTISRSMTFPAPTQSTVALAEAARGLFEAWPFQSVRLIGMTAERLSAPQIQLPLFVDDGSRRQEALDNVSDAINEKFGKRTLRRGSST